MQFKTIVLSSFLGLVAAASSDVTSLTSQLPSCSKTCLAEGASAANCDSTDYTCQCENQDTVTANSSACVSTSCSVSDISTTQKVITEICDALSTNGTTSNSTASSTASSTSSSSSSSSTTGSSAGSHMDFAGLGWAAVVGVAAFVAM
ncbi:hypothetical protein N0V93_000843 [Gnomoniopsis smithogilvyi]|uniref:CFEM domain-containing protein n=1 Tax=Gnomoniopsis smithogilvyi TaxID=1191159 RepID=A0A9W8Z0K8_9PEZI|nr:hypothetical protein N0V93_000843 [Gnomoniopsis smithogilvyi]